MLLRLAPGSDQPILGGPAWLATDRFDISAKFNVNDQSRVPAMLQTLLVERFGLVAHRETRPMPVYVLTLARTDGEIGSGLTPSRLNCSAELRPCGATMDNGYLRARGATLAAVATNNRSFLVERKVVDWTRLEGIYDFEIRFTPEIGTAAASPLP